MFRVFSGKLLTCSEERKPVDVVKVCEIIRNSLKTQDTCDGGDLSTAEPCPGCRQEDVCVCLTPPALARGSSQGITPTSSSRKRTYTQELQKKGSLPSVDHCSLAYTNKNNKTHYSPNSPSSSISFSELECFSSVNTSMPLENGNHSPMCVDELDVQKPLPKKVSQVELLYEELIHNNIHKPHCLSPSCAAPAVYPPLAYNLLLRLLDPNPVTRITAEEALAHPFLNL